MYGRWIHSQGVTTDTFQQYIVSRSRLPPRNDFIFLFSVDSPSFIESSEIHEKHQVEQRTAHSANDAIFRSVPALWSTGGTFPYHSSRGSTDAKRNVDSQP